MYYRIRSSGDIKTQGEIRKMHPNVSLPRTWNENVFEALGIDPINEGVQADVNGPYEISVRHGIEQIDGKWFTKYVVGPVFQDYTDEEGVTHTKVEQEAEYQARKDAEAAKSVRSTRDTLLAETDWTGLSDVTMSNEMATYRQALRDITTHANFPHLEDADWPTKP